MHDMPVWSLIAILGLITIGARGSFIAFSGRRELSPRLARYLRYVAVAIIPAMIAPLTIFPKSLGGETHPGWIIAALVALLVGLKTKNPLIIMIAGAAAFLLQSLVTKWAGPLF